MCRGRRGWHADCFLIALRWRLPDVQKPPAAAGEEIMAEPRATRSPDGSLLDDRTPDNQGYAEDDAVSEQGGAGSIPRRMSSAMESAPPTDPDEDEPEVARALHRAHQPNASAGDLVTRLTLPPGT